MKILTLVFSLCLLLAAAKSEAGFGFDPNIVETSAKPGVPHTGSISIRNSSDRSLDVRVQVENWLKRRVQDSELVDIEPDEWLSIPSSFSIGANETKEVEYEINLPADLEGQLVAMAFFSEAPDDSGGVTIRTRYGVCIYAAAKGTEELHVDLGSPRVFEGKRFRITLTNQGNVHLRPEGKVIATDGNGNTYEARLRAGSPVHPGQDHSYLAVFDDYLPEGDYIAQAVISYGRIYGRDYKVKSEAVEFTR